MTQSGSPDCSVAACFLRVFCADLARRNVERASDRLDVADVDIVWHFDVVGWAAIAVASTCRGGDRSRLCRAGLGMFEHRLDQVRMNLEHEVPQDSVVDFPTL